MLVHSDTNVSVKPPKGSIYSQNKQSLQSLMQTMFQFSYVFPAEISQKEFFMATIHPCFDKFFKGDNLLIFSYGVTNSGKTYTMQGTNSNPGLIPRTLDVLFDSLKDNLDTSKSIYHYKPDRFNEICSLNDTELNTELVYKETLLRLSNQSMKGGLERVESFESIKDLDDKESFAQLSKKFSSSLDSLAALAAGDQPLTSTTTTTTATASAAASNHIDDNNCGTTFKARVSPNTKYAIWISFYELYNDNIYDLLATPAMNRSNKANIVGSNDRPSLKIREDINRIPYVEGLIYIPVFNTREAIKILKYGEKNLQKSSNSLNLTSSRSHAVFNMKIVALTNTTVSINQ